MEDVDQASAPISPMGLLCPRCRGGIDAQDGYCRHCGHQMASSSWYHGRIFVLSMLFLVVGPLALPLLWRSPTFGLKSKVAITVANIAYTAFFLYGAKMACVRLTGLEELLSNPQGW